MQAARFHFPVIRDLRRHRLSLGLRPARHRAQAQPPGALVERDGPHPREHRRPRLGDPHASARMGSERARQWIRRSDGGLPQLQEAVSRRRSENQGDAGYAGCAVPCMRNERNTR